MRKVDERYIEMKEWKKLYPCLEGWFPNQDSKSRVNLHNIICGDCLRAFVCVCVYRKWYEYENQIFIVNATKSIRLQSVSGDDLE